MSYLNRPNGYAPTGEVNSVPKQLTMQDHLDKAAWHIAQAQAMQHNTTHDTAVATRCADEQGWVSDNRCPEPDTMNSISRYGHVGAMPHAAHPYQGNGQWCDGYV